MRETLGENFIRANPEIHWCMYQWKVFLKNWVLHRVIYTWNYLLNYFSLIRFIKIRWEPLDQLSWLIKQNVKAWINPLSINKDIVY